MRIISDGSPIVKLTSPTKLYELNEAFIVEFNQGIMVIPKGFQTDLASVPECFWWWRWGKFDIAAIAHDFFYEFGCRVDSNGNKTYLTKQEADKIFYELMLALKVNKITAKLMYLAVILFGKYKPIRNIEELTNEN